MIENRYRLVVCEVHNKCTSSDGEWDGCWDTFWEWTIYDEHFEEVESRYGYFNREEAEVAGNKVLNELLNK